MATDMTDEELEVTCGLLVWCPFRIRQESKQLESFATPQLPFELGKPP